MLDDGSKRPLYHLLAERLFEQIRAGAFTPGQKIPSEHELSATYGIGRPTVRQATDTLIARGVLRRRRGSGTFVVNVPIEVDLFSLAGTLVSFEASGVKLVSRLVEPTERRVVDDESHPMHGKMAVHVVRLSRVKRVPVLLEEMDFDSAFFPGLEGLALDGRSLSEVVQSKYRLRVRMADQTFRVEALSERIAGHFSLDERAQQSGLLRVDRTLHFDGADHAVFSRMYCRTEHFVFSQRIGGSFHA